MSQPPVRKRLADRQPRAPEPEAAPAAPLPPARAWWWLAALVVPLAAGMVYEGQRHFRADWASAAARLAVVDWAAGLRPAPTAAEWQQAEEALLASRAITPDDPALHDRLGDLYVVAGRRDWNDEPVSTGHFRQAMQHYQAALALRPKDPGTWAMLAVAYQAMGAPREQVYQAWRRARQLGPQEGNVQPVLLQLALADWEGAPPDVQAWAQALFLAASPPVRSQINVLAKEYGLEFQASEPEPATKP